MQLAFLLEQVVNGLVLGGYYLLLALGLSLIFSVGGVVNLAHGAFYALGAYASLEVGRRLGFGAAVVLGVSIYRTRMRAYVSGATGGLAIVDLAALATTTFVDSDENGVDDRVLEVVPIPEIQPGSPAELDGGPLQGVPGH